MLHTAFKKKANTILSIVLALLLILLALSLIVPFKARATSNPIQQENQLPGTTSWQLTNPDSYVNYRYSTIEGYAWATSVSAGNILTFSVSTTAPTFTADVYRLGWYQGTGARLITTLFNLAGSFYQSAAMDPTTGLVDNNWPAAFTLTPDSTWVSGEYLVKLTASTGSQSYIPFTLTDTRSSDFVFVHADNTSQAYNAWGGKSLYEFNSTSNKRAYKVSLDRPYDRNTGAGDLLNWEYPTIHWLERNGYDVSYISDVDVAVNPSLLQNHKAILIVGHSEYWSKEMRDNVEADVGAGINLGVFAANTMGWQIRYEPQPFGTQPLPNRVIVCYKDATLDPLYGVDNSHVTVMFRDPPVNRPEQSILGVSYNDYNSSMNFPWVVSNASSWLFAGTGLQNGDSIPQMVGYEYDVIFSYYPIPQGDQAISSSPVTGLDGTKSTSNSTIYTAASGARVFDSGSMNWNFGLDSYASPYDAHPDYTNANVQLITQNLLQNFLSGGTPTPTPTPTTTSTPTPTPTTTSTPTPTPTTTSTPTPTPTPTPLTVSITNPVNGSTVARTSKVTITANASDTVAVTKVEFYVNGTLTCTATTSPYSCGWKVPGSKGATYTLLAKAYDVTGNTATNTVQVTASH